MSRLFIDVREPEEFSTGYVEGAVNVPPSDLLRGAPVLQGIPKDTELVVYCVSGSRSNAAIHVLSELGFTNIQNGINKDQVIKKYHAKLALLT